jgi:hypothetical protein
MRPNELQAARWRRLTVDAPSEWVGRLPSMIVRETWLRSAPMTKRLPTTIAFPSEWRHGSQVFTETPESNYNVEGFACGLTSAHRIVPTGRGRRCCGTCHRPDRRADRPFDRAASPSNGRCRRRTAERNVRQCPGADHHADVQFHAGPHAVRYASTGAAPDGGASFTLRTHRHRKRPENHGRALEHTVSCCSERAISLSLAFLDSPSAPRRGGPKLACKHAPPPQQLRAAYFRHSHRRLSCGCTLVWTPDRPQSRSPGSFPRLLVSLQERRAGSACST